ncbi:transcription factor Adf-1-like [Schistocerca nitens]|uniref:transcription factor Adf-1-like n=1 Tax=Schistocerca nitens TaxID=7011 RepID=UPI002118F776|nr:transcription factor Adf-1-like [Schistocerca nitens]
MKTERLIEEVRQYNFLYDTRDPDYKNILKKAEAWRDIAAKLDQNAETLKTKWRNLRDAYVKHKKLVKGTTGHSLKRYRSWPWSEHMRFMDCALEARPTTSNIPCSTEAVTSDSERHSQPGQHSSDSTIFPQPELLTHEYEGESQEQCTEVLEPSSARKKPTAKKMRKEGPSADVECIISYLQKKHQFKDKHDEVDHLFLSYAKTYKRLTVRSQAKLKVQLAQLFADAELAELDEQQPTANSKSFSRLGPR